MIIPLSIASIATVLTGISIPGHADEGHDKRAGVAQNVTVTILSSNLANGNSVGEWGLSALVQADGACVLFLSLIHI